MSSPDATRLVWAGQTQHSVAMDMSQRKMPFKLLTALLCDALSLHVSSLAKKHQTTLAT